MKTLAITLLILSTERGPVVVQAFKAPGMCGHLAAQLSKTDHRPMRCVTTRTQGADA